MNDFTFDTEQLPEEQDRTFTVYDAGTYNVLIADIEQKPMKDDKGNMAVVSLQFTEGPYKDKTYTEWLCLDFPTNPETEERAKSRLRSYAKACGFSGTVSAKQMVNKRVSIVVAKYVSKKTGEDQNAINKVLPIGGSTPTATVTPITKPKTMGWGAK